MFQAAPLYNSRQKLLSEEKLAALIAFSKTLGVKSVANFFSDKFFNEILKKLPGKKGYPKGTEKHKQRWRNYLSNRHQSYYAEICYGMFSLLLEFLAFYYYIFFIVYYDYLFMNVMLLYILLYRTHLINFLFNFY